MNPSFVQTRAADEYINSFVFDNAESGSPVIDNQGGRSGDGSGFWDWYNQNGEAATDMIKTAYCLAFPKKCKGNVQVVEQRNNNTALYIGAVIIVLLLLIIILKK